MLRNPSLDLSWSQYGGGRLRTSVKILDTSYVLEASLIMQQKNSVEASRRKHPKYRVYILHLDCHKMLSDLPQSLVSMDGTPCSWK
jgi:hypothetical protein